ncbi:hypothetical protein K450DRAFT_228028 [Umbelopsis ramanniana AG]|uniref:Uncharacterized protein n=1 Tax=Umbelopsis ramanniana AG TaxID=1314678 RepID=A0AAD5EG10_UMBRA|nr:uncharacterized protein K450DRAFT_228028 [Umbelopsis ramanniana AG]KAI8582236.1 hypothetical protein K450DRAFT_228028 [Umbelopsis ramanniana AG]
MLSTHVGNHLKQSTLTYQLYKCHMMTFLTCMITLSSIFQTIFLFHCRRCLQIFWLAQADILKKEAI